MLKFEGSERTTAEKALQHSYFSEAPLAGSSCETSEGYHIHSPDSSSGSASPTSSSSILSTSTDSGIQES